MLDWLSRFHRAGASRPQATPPGPQPQRRESRVCLYVGCHWCGIPELRAPGRQRRRPLARPLATLSEHCVAGRISLVVSSVCSMRVHQMAASCLSPDQNSRGCRGPCLGPARTLPYGNLAAVPSMGCRHYLRFLGEAPRPRGPCSQRLCCHGMSLWMSVCLSQSPPLPAMLHLVAISPCLENSTRGLFL